MHHGVDISQTLIATRVEGGRGLSLHFNEKLEVPRRDIVYHWVEVRTRRGFLLFEARTRVQEEGNQLTIPTLVGVFAHMLVNDQANRPDVLAGLQETPDPEVFPQNRVEKTKTCLPRDPANVIVAPTRRGDKFQGRGKPQYTPKPPGRLYNPPQCGIGLVDSHCRSRGPDLVRGPPISRQTPQQI